MMFCWLQVFYILVHPQRVLCNDADTNNNNNRIKIALYVSFLELFNSLIGITQSKPQQVLLFSIIRYGVESIVSPYIGCSSWQHILTVACWSIGDTIRFGCFLFDTLLNETSRIPKYIRYTVGPFLFPLGTLGEMSMVIAVANQSKSTINRILIYSAASLWPVGFFYLFQRLLKQRQKFMKNSATIKTPIKVKV
jgi:Protein tyrosine phosphatase-like protein, PTPLA